MALSLGAGAAIGGAAQGLVGLGSSIIQGEYNKKMQERANEFTREQSQNQIKYNIKQMQELGYSPMMLFDHGNATGGGAGSGKIGAAAPDFGAGIIAGINTVGKILEKDARNDLAERRIDQQQDYNDHYFQYINRKLGNQNTPNYEQRKYSPEQINALYDKL